jgi:hypothetical protein
VRFGSADYSMAVGASHELGQAREFERDGDELAQNARRLLKAVSVGLLVLLEVEPDHRRGLGARSQPAFLAPRAPNIDALPSSAARRGRLNERDRLGRQPVAPFTVQLGGRAELELLTAFRKGFLARLPLGRARTFDGWRLDRAIRVADKVSHSAAAD